MRYVDALKIWNQTETNGKWCFVEKGSIGHKQVLEIMKNGEAPKSGPNKRIIKVKRTKKKQVGGMDGNGMILPGRQQRGKGADLPWDVILDIAQNPIDYINKAGKFLDSQNASKQMALQIERETGARRLFKFPWE